MKGKTIACLLMLLAGLVSAYGQDPAANAVDTFIVKFKTTSPFRLRKPGISPEWFYNQQLLPRADTAFSRVQQELSQFTNTLTVFGATTVNKLFPNDDRYYDLEHYTIQPRTGLLLEQQFLRGNSNIPDLNGYYLITVRYGPGLSRQQFIDSLKNNNAVDTAYPLYHTVDATLPNAPCAAVHLSGAEIDSDYTNQQLYLGDSSGIHAASSWALPGGMGDNVKIIDIEFNWNDHHADLKPIWLLDGDLNNRNANPSDHGTAVLGELVGVHNNFGVNGICPNIDYGLMSVGPHCILSVAIARATEALRPGDIILIEQQLTADTRPPGPPGCSDGQFGDLPVEATPDCREAIVRATRKGIIVVETAGNGHQDLDDPRYGGRFDPANSSGAIMVAADDGGDAKPTCFTNYGRRINYYAWGSDVVTTGIGDLLPGSTDPNHQYTDTFNGTSSASPIIVGVIADLQGIRRAKNLPIWNAVDFLHNIKGKPQAAGTISKPIGIFPDLSSTLNSIF